MSPSLLDTPFNPIRPQPLQYAEGTSSLDMANQAYAYNTQLNAANANSWTGKGGVLDRGMGLAGKGIGLASSLGQLYVGLKSLGIAEDELKIKKDQWAMSKAEIQHMQGVRRRLTASYMGNKPVQGRATSALAR